MQLQDERGTAMLARIGQRVDRASHTVAQLLTLARLDPEQGEASTRVCMQTLLADALADTSHLADERGLTVMMDADETALVTGSEESLFILVCNLMINAFNYSTDNSAVRIALRGGDAVELEVFNDCAPLSAQEFDLICERFYRAPGSSGQGAGLGLSIVSHIAQQHDAVMRVGPAESGEGFRVQLIFPGAARPA